MRRPARRTDRGAVTVVTALVTCTVLFVVAALTVDLGNAMARNGHLQHQVDRAAKFAAEKLPVDSTTVTASPSDAQLEVAKAAAYYLACHEVHGQDVSVTLPACPAGAAYDSDTAITTYARTLLTNGRTPGVSAEGEVWFPSVNEVEVVGPLSQVDFGFGAVAGADGTSSYRTARAVVMSPGDVLPIGLSVTCLAASLGAAPLGAGDTVSKVVPVNYVSTGYPTTDSAVPIESRPPDPGDTYFGDVEVGNKAGSISMNVSLSTISPTGEVSLVLDWAANKNGFTVEEIHVFVRKDGYQQGDPTGFYDLVIPVLEILKQTGTVTFTKVLPPGDYEAMVLFRGRNGGIGARQTWGNNQNVEFTVPVRGAVANLVTCARPAQSPRSGITSDADALAVNLAQGVDHPLAAFPGLGDAVDGVSLPAATAVASVPGLLAAADSAFRCDSSSRVRKDYPTRRTDGANCVRVDTSQDWSEPLTRGLLTGGTAAAGSFSGRLRCPASGSCNFSGSRATLTNPGGITGTYNDDRFSDFVTTPSLLNDPFLMSLDSFISPSLPLVTPPSTAVDDALYESPRFFWAPVVLTTYATSAPGAAGDYSILSFRPVFLTSDETTSTTAAPIDTLLLRLIQSAQASGYHLQNVLKNFADSSSGLNPCDGTGTTIVSLLTLILTGAQANACELALLKTRLFSSTTGSTTTVARFLHKYLGSNIAVSDSANTQSFGGLVIDKAAARVRAARLMTIAPGALPAVARNYSGPTAPYLGVGPKIIRLTR